MSAKDIFKVIVSVLPKLIKLGIDCKKEVGEFNLAEDLPTILNFAAEAAKAIIDSLKTED